MTKPLKWRRAAPQDYRATLPDGAEAKVTGKYVDDRDYDGGTLTGWQWTAEVNDQFVMPCGVALSLMRDAKAAVQQYVGRNTETKD